MHALTNKRLDAMPAQINGLGATKLAGVGKPVGGFDKPEYLVFE